MNLGRIGETMTNGETKTKLIFPPSDDSFVCLKSLQPSLVVFSHLFSPTEKMKEFSHHEFRTLSYCLLRRD